MEAYQFTNAFPAELASDLTSNATTLVLKSGHGANFPQISLGQSKSFKVCVKDKNGNLEIVKIIMRAGGSDTLIVGTSAAHQPGGNAAGRAQEGTSALAITYSDDHVVELRLTAAIAQDWSDAINTLIADLDIEEAALVAHQASDDHDGRYFTETELTNGQLDSRYYTKTNVQTSGQASVHAGNLTNKNAINHSDLTDNEADKHRLINDAGSGATELWSASKISTQLGGKSDNGHNHNSSYSGLWHDHDSRYYTEGEIASILGNYYTAAQVNAAIAAAIATHAALTSGVHGLNSGGGE